LSPSARSAMGTSRVPSMYRRGSGSSDRAPCRSRARPTPWTGGPTPFEHRHRAARPAPCRSLRPGASPDLRPRADGRSSNRPGGSRSLDGEQIRVEGLAAVVHLCLHIGPLVPEPLGDPSGVAAPDPSPSMMVTRSCESVTSTSSSAQAASASESHHLDPPAGQPSQSPSAIGPARQSESRTARVTSPGTTLAGRGLHGLGVHDPSASGS
jgi:hypothetical protein